MSYQQSAAVERHFLDSILPYEIKAYESKQFTKSKQFYKPEEFIWNNPHRTSSSIYKFYHKYNKDYQTFKQPVIKKIQEANRKQQQLSRIRRLSDVKVQTKKRFFQRKHQRENLEYLSGTRLPLNSESQYITSAVKRFSTISHYQPKPTKYESMIPQQISNKPTKKSSITNNLQQSYINGVERSLLKKKFIQKLIIQETFKQQQKLREHFEKQKLTNQKKLSRISKFTSSKIDKTFSCKQS